MSRLPPAFFLAVAVLAAGVACFAAGFLAAGFAAGVAAGFAATGADLVSLPLPSSYPAFAVLTTLPATLPAPRIAFLRPDLRPEAILPRIPGRLVPVLGESLVESSLSFSPGASLAAADAFLYPATADPATSPAAPATFLATFFAPDATFFTASLTFASLLGLLTSELES